MKQHFLASMTELKAIIAANTVKGIKTGPVITGLYLRLQKVFETN